MNMHDEWCPCADCEGRPMLGLALSALVSIVLLTAIFMWAR